MEFTTWNDLATHVAAQMGGLKPFSGQGIRNYTNGMTLLRSVPVPYYADTEDKYTAQGLVGNQDLQKKVNRVLQEPNRRIFLYDVRVNGKTKTWVWHGERQFRGEIESMQHPDIHGSMRTIYRFVLHKP